MKLAKLIVAIGIAAIVWAIPISGFAANRPHPPTGPLSQQVSPREGSPAPGATASIVQGSFWCTFAIANPHESGHFPGTVAVTATVTCPVTMSQISIQTILWWSMTGNGWSIVGNSGTVNYYGYAYGTATAGANCSTGFYQGEATDYLVGPPGYGTASGTVWSNEIATTC